MELKKKIAEKKAWLLKSLNFLITRAKAVYFSKIIIDITWIQGVEVREITIPIKINFMGIKCDK
jgi:hypothetical protein